MIKFLKKYKTQLGLTLLEALISTAIVGIGFVAVFNMVNFSVQSIDTSGERTKEKYDTYQGDDVSGGLRITSTSRFTDRSRKKK